MSAWSAEKWWSYHNVGRDSTASRGAMRIHRKLNAFRRHQQQLVDDGHLHRSLVSGKAEQLFHSLRLWVTSGRPQQGRPKHCRQVLQSHLVLVLVLGHPDNQQYYTLASCLSYAPKRASANFVDSWCPFRCWFGCVLLLNQIFWKQCTVRQYTTPIYLINLLWKLVLGLGLDSELHYFSIFHGEWGKWAPFLPRMSRTVTSC